MNELLRIVFRNNGLIGALLESAGKTGLPTSHSIPVPSNISKTNSNVNDIFRVSHWACTCHMLTNPGADLPAESVQVAWLREAVKTMDMKPLPKTPWTGYSALHGMQNL